MFNESRARGEQQAEPPRVKFRRPKLVVELKELNEIYSRFRRIFLLTTVLTVLLTTYVIIELARPQTLERVHTFALSSLLGGAIILCIAQYFCLRHTTETSRRKIEELTFIDDLTQVYNYRYLDRRLAEELRIAKRFHVSLSVVYIDMDNFKRVNDEYGHQVGNQVLSQVGEFLSMAARTTDLIGRMGGDEFLLILPNTDRDEAQIVSERIRQRMEQHQFQIGNGRVINYLRLSMGVASYPMDGEDKDTLIACADQAMYRAKQTGGNRVCI